MRRLIGAGMLAAALAMPASVAGAPLATFTDPTTDGEEGAFSGSYDNGSGGTSYQEGYVGIYSDGVVACNGQNHVVAGQNLQGYAWVGSGYRAANPSAETPNGEAGVGTGADEPSGAPSGGSPCPDADPDGLNE